MAARVIQGVGGALLTPGQPRPDRCTFHPTTVRGRSAPGRPGRVSGSSGPAGRRVSGRGGHLAAPSSSSTSRWGRSSFGPRAGMSPRAATRRSAGGWTWSARPLATVALAGITFAFIQASDHGIGSAAGDRRPPDRARSRGRFRAWSSATARTRCCRSRSSDPASSPARTWSPSPSTRRSAAVFFLLVVFLQVGLGYSPDGGRCGLAAVTVIMLGLSARDGCAGAANRPALSPDRRAHC